MLAESVAPQIAQEVSSASTGEARRAAAKSHLKSIGLTASDWADRHGYSRKTVYKVLEGTLKGNFGISHNIAVRLAVKDGVIDPAFEPAIVKEAAHG